MKKLFGKIIGNDYEKKIKVIAAKDFYKTGCLCLIVCTLFEVYYIIDWFIHEKDFSSLYSVRYLIGYVITFTFSVVAYIIVKYIGTDLEKHQKTLITIEVITALILIIWEVVASIFDYYDYGFNGILVGTIFIILPAVIYVNKYFLVILYVISSSVILIFLLCEKPQFWDELVINFIVFSIISFIAAYSHSKTRRIAIMREIELHELSHKDPLTKLNNRLNLTASSNDILKINLESKSELSCIMMDIDDFKKVNDTYGHKMGDDVLIKVSEILNDISRNLNGSAYRYGGEEFLIVLSNTSSNQAINACKSIQELLKKVSIEGLDKNVTLSFGVFTAIPNETDVIEKFFDKADELLYESKRNGKNRYTVDNRI